MNSCINITLPVIRRDLLSNIPIQSPERISYRIEYNLQHVSHSCMAPVFTTDVTAIMLALNVAEVDDPSYNDTSHVVVG